MKYIWPIVILLLFSATGCSYERGFLISDFLPESFYFNKISTYGIMMACGFLTANFLVQKEFYRLKLPLKLGDNLIIGAAIGGISGAKIFFVLETYNSWYGFDGFIRHLFSGAGLTWYGGMIVACLVCFIILRRGGYSFLRMADITTPMMAMGYVFGRLGCLVSGDGCYGIACNIDLPAPFCMAFPNGAADWSHGPGVTVYNTPFFEGFVSLLLFTYFYLIRQKEWPLGVKFFIFVFIHSLFRFLVEFIRLNPTDVFGVTQAQFISIVMMLSCFGYFYYRRGEIVEYWRKNANPGH